MVCWDSWARSIKTRIETSQTSKDQQKRFLIREQDPLKQGLKLDYLRSTIADSANSWARSIKTRIETVNFLKLYLFKRYSWARSIKTRIETYFQQILLRRGFRYSWARSIKTRIETIAVRECWRGVLEIREQDPLKQGLKRTSAGVICLRLANSWARSIKTRIETAFQAQGHDALSYSWARSTKTRIETSWSSLTLIPKKIFVSKIH